MTEPRDFFERQKLIKGSNLPPTERYILLTLNTYADGLGQNCYPGQDTLADDTGYNRRTVTRTLSILRDKNVLTWETNGKKHVTTATNDYTILFDEVAKIQRPSKKKKKKSSKPSKSTHKEAMDTESQAIECIINKDIAHPLDLESHPPSGSRISGINTYDTRSQRVEILDPIPFGSLIPQPLDRRSHDLSRDLSIDSSKKNIQGYSLFHSSKEEYSHVDTVESTFEKNTNNFIDQKKTSSDSPTSEKDQNSAASVENSGLLPWQKVTDSFDVVTDQELLQRYLGQYFTAHGNNTLLLRGNLKRLFEAGYIDLWVGPSEWDWRDGAIAVAKKRIIAHTKNESPSNDDAKRYINNRIDNAWQKDDWSDVKAILKDAIAWEERRSTLISGGTNPPSSTRVDKLVIPQVELDLSTRTSEHEAERLAAVEKIKNIIGVKPSGSQISEETRLPKGTGGAVSTQIAKLIDIELNRLRWNCYLPYQWIERTGKLIYSDLESDDRQDYLSYLKTLSSETPQPEIVAPTPQKLGPDFGNQAQLLNHVTVSDA